MIAVLTDPLTIAHRECVRYTIDERRERLDHEINEEDISAQRESIKKTCCIFVFCSRFLASTSRK